VLVSRYSVSKSREFTASSLIYKKLVNLPEASKEQQISQQNSHTIATTSLFTVQTTIAVEGSILFSTYTA
jgi:hypothetical protein